MALVSNGSFNNGIKMGKNYNYGGLIEIEKIMSFSGKWMQLQIAMLNKIHQPAPPPKKNNITSFHLWIPNFIKTHTIISTYTA